MLLPLATLPEVEPEADLTDVADFGRGGGALVGCGGDSTCEGASLAGRGSEGSGGVRGGVGGGFGPCRDGLVPVTAGDPGALRLGVLARDAEVVLLLAATGVEAEASVPGACGVMPAVPSLGDEVGAEIDDEADCRTDRAGVDVDVDGVRAANAVPVVNRELATDVRAAFLLSTDVRSEEGPPATGEGVKSLSIVTLCTFAVATLRPAFGDRCAGPCAPPLSRSSTGCSISAEHNGNPSTQTLFVRPSVK